MKTNMEGRSLVIVSYEYDEDELQLFSPLRDVMMSWWVWPSVWPKLPSSLSVTGAAADLPLTTDHTPQ